jgi:hypothetical protein
MSAMSETLLAYTPSAPALAGVGVVVVALVAGGYSVTRLRSRLPAWILGAAALAATLYFVGEEPAGVRMVAIVATLLLAMKAIVATSPSTTLTFHQWIAFTGWPGMRPSIFEALGGPRREGAGRLAMKGLLSLAGGILLLLVAHNLALLLPPAAARLCGTPLLLVGLSLALHFGLLNLLAAGWRMRGVEAERLFRDPFHATSLADFWSHRWNLAFTEMTAAVIYRPVRQLAGRNVGVFASFVASGLLHEMAISVPARAGYGLPTLYFALQGLLVLHGSRSRVVMFLALVAPILLVFHVPFLRTVLWPLVGIR